MKNNKGFVVQGIIAIVALILIAGGAYAVSKNKIPKEESIVKTTEGVSGWKTYINNEHGFSIQYPSSWVAEPSNDSSSVNLISPEDKKLLDKPYGHLELQDKLNIFDVIVYPDRGIEPPYTKKENVLVDGKPVEKIISNGPDNSSTYVQYVKDGKKYILSFPKDEVSIKIFESFKFISPIRNTYNDSKYSFSVQYPKDWVTSGLKTSPLGGFDYINFGTADSVQKTPLAKIQIYPNETTLSDFIKINQGMAGTWSDTSINGIPAKRFTKADQGEHTLPIVLYMFVKDGRGYEIQSTLPGEYAMEVEAIASSFNFPSPQPCSNGATNPPHCNADLPISTQPSITVLSPKGGENWKIGQTYNIFYKTNADLGPLTIALVRYSDDSTPVNSTIIGTSQTNNISYTVPSNVVTTNGRAGRYKIEVYPSGGRELVARSQDYFTITN